MTFATAARVGATASVDTSWESGDVPPNPAPWPWPPGDGPYPVPVDPIPPTPPDVPQDVVGDTYRFTHIVKSLDQRLVDNEKAASGLSTTNPDRLVTYTQINTARAKIESLYEDFVEDDATDFDNYNDLLAYVGIFPFLNGLNEWLNLDSDGTTLVIANDMASDDEFISWLLFDLEAVLRSLIYYDGGQTLVTTLTGISVQASHVTQTNLTSWTVTSTDTFSFVYQAGFFNAHGKSPEEPPDKLDSREIYVDTGIGDYASNPCGQSRAGQPYVFVDIELELALILNNVIELGTQDSIPGDNIGTSFEIQIYRLSGQAILQEFTEDVHLGTWVQTDPL